MIEWETVEGWVRTWLDMINYTFDNALRTSSLSFTREQESGAAFQQVLHRMLKIC